MNKNYLHIIVAAVLAFFLLARADLVPFWMPMIGEMIALLIVVILMLVWAGFVMQETAHDEREVLLKMKSRRGISLGSRRAHDSDHRTRICTRD